MNTEDVRHLRGLGGGARRPRGGSLWLAPAEIFSSATSGRSSRGARRDGVTQPERRSKQACATSIGEPMPRREPALSCMPQDDCVLQTLRTTPGGPVQCGIVPWTGAVRGRQRL